MSFTKLAAEIWRGFVTDGVAGSGVHKPIKADIRTWGTEVEAAAGSGYASFMGMPATGTVTDDKHKALLMLPADGTWITATLDAPANLRDNFQVELFNPPYSAAGVANVRRHRIISQFETFYLAPGHSARFLKTGGAVIRIDKPSKWLKSGIVMYCDQAASQTYFDGMVAGAGGAKKTMGACLAVLLADIDTKGDNPQIVVTGTFTENVRLNGGYESSGYVKIGAPAVNLLNWYNGAQPYCLMVANGATAILQNVNFNRNALANIIFLQAHQKAVVDIGDPGQGLGQSIVFAGAGATGSCLSTDGAGSTININQGIEFGAGSYGTMIFISGASSLNWTGSTLVKHSGAVTCGTYLQMIGSGANASLAGGIDFASAGTVQPGCTKFVLALCASLSLSGNVLPGNIAGNASSGAEYV